jgi:MYXO-CTERM domain-containing protein
VARNLAFVERGAGLDTFVSEAEREHTVVELLSEGDPSLAPPPVAAEPEPTQESEPNEPAADVAALSERPSEPGCAHCTSGRASTGTGLLGLLALLGVRRRRRT